jgi:nucleoside-diphosphate-sugar epimerase
MIVVTAAGGRTGTAVVRALRERGAEVRAVVAAGTRSAGVPGQSLVDQRDVADAVAGLLAGHLRSTG